MPVNMLPVANKERRRMGQLNRMLGVGFKRKTHQSPIKHGTRYAYVKHRCPCDACLAANREYQRSHRSDRHGVPKKLHGKPNTYSYHGCRCSACRLAATAYRMELFRRKRDANAA